MGQGYQKYLWRIATKFVPHAHADMSFLTSPNLCLKAFIRRDQLTHEERISKTNLRFCNRLKPHPTSRSILSWFYKALPCYTVCIGLTELTKIDSDSLQPWLFRHRRRHCRHRRLGSSLRGCFNKRRNSIFAAAEEEGDEGAQLRVVLDHGRSRPGRSNFFQLLLHQLCKPFIC